MCSVVGVVAVGGECVLVQVNQHWKQVKWPTMERCAVAVFVAASGVKGAESG